MISRLHIRHDNNESNHSSSIETAQTSKDIDSYRIISFLSTASTVAVQQEDGGHWMHKTMVGHGTDKHKGRSYKIQVMKIGYIITRIKTLEKASPISVEDYLRKEISENNRLQTKKLIHCFDLLNWHECLAIWKQRRKTHHKKQDSHQGTQTLTNEEK